MLNLLCSNLLGDIHFHSFWISLTPEVEYVINLNKSKGSLQVKSLNLDNGSLMMKVVFRVGTLELMSFNTPLQTVEIAERRAYREDDLWLPVKRNVS